MRTPHSARSRARTRRSLTYGLALLAAAATALMTSVTGTAAAATAPAGGALHRSGQATATTGHYGVVPQRSAATRQTPVKPAVSGVLQYYGGPVQHTLSVYLDFWGSQWNNDANGVKSYMTNLFNGLGTSSDHWSTVTSQYTDYSGGHPSFGGAVLRGVWSHNTVSAPGSASASQISSEANTAAGHFGVSGSNVQIVVLSPSGTHPDGFPNSGFCAWHDYNGNVPYTNMPYVLDAGSGCGEYAVQSALDGFSIVEGHEYAETATDPEPSSGWLASDGEENGDLCAWQNLGTISLPTGTFAMQPTWSDAVNGCAMSG